jgi:probable rRNA maturation factor
MSTDFVIHCEVDDAFAAGVDLATLTSTVQHLLRLRGVTTGSLTLAITDDETVQRLNRDFRGIDAPTDVLSFAHEADAGETLALPPELAAEMDGFLGDIVIAFPYAKRQAAHYQNEVNAELRLLAVHGTLHLLGYDHATPEEEAAMWALQEEALAPFGDHGLSHRRYET